MHLYQAIFLSIVQGITEFLPISSSGHLVLFQKVFGITDPPVLFDVLLHLGTLFAILVFFGKDIFSLIVDWKKKKNIWLFLVTGSIPAAILGFFLNSKINEIFNSLFLLGSAWMFFGLLLLVSYKFPTSSTTRSGLRGASKIDLKKKEDDVIAKDGLVVGLFQALALLPGISRSGSTIIGGLWRGFSRETAFKMSFLLSIPAILGAAVLKLKDSHLNGIGVPVGVISIFLAAVVGYFSLKFLQKILKSDKFYLFGFYCLAIGILTLILNFIM